MALILERPWTRQPTGRRALNPEWVAKGLIRFAQPWAGFDGARGFTSNTAPLVQTNAGAALDIAGATRYADINSAAHGITNRVTVCALVQADALGAFPMILSAASSAGDGSEGFELRLNNNVGQPQFMVDEATGRQAATIAQNIVGSGTRFIAGRYDGQNINVFLDETKSANQAASGNISGINGSVWRIGDRPFSGTAFTGKVIGLAVFASALSDDEIQTVRRNMWQLLAPRRISVPQAAAGGAYSITAQAGSYALTGQPATISRSKLITASAGSYALTGQQATISRNRQLSASAGSYVVTGQTATLLRSRLIAASAGAYSYTGQSADITYSGTGAYTLTAQAGSYSLAGQSATLTKSKLINASAGSYAMTGRSATITYSGAPAPGGLSGVYFDVLSGRLLVLRARS